jgi:hypothetical protein
VENNQEVVVDPRHICKNFSLGIFVHASALLSQSNISKESHNLLKSPDTSKSLIDFN